MTAINWTKTEAGFSFSHEATSTSFEIIRANRRFRLMVEGEKYGKDGSLAEKKEIADQLLADRQSRVGLSEETTKKIDEAISSDLPIEAKTEAILSAPTAGEIMRIEEAAREAQYEENNRVLAMPSAESRTSAPTPKASHRPKPKQVATGMPNNAPLDPVMLTNHPDYVSPETIAYNRKYGISEEATRMLVKDQKEKAKTRQSSSDKPKTDDEIFREMPLSDRLFLERRAAATEGRDQAMITEENVNEIHSARMAGDKIRKTVVTENGEKVVTSTKVHTKLSNVHGVDLAQSSTGRYSIAGESLTSIFRWFGFKGWTHDEAMACMKNLGVNPEAFKEATVRLQMNSGKKGAESHYGPVPTLSDDQASALEKAAGKDAPAPKKTAPKPKAATPAPVPTAPPGTAAFEKQWKAINKTGAKK